MKTNSILEIENYYSKINYIIIKVNYLLKIMFKYHQRY